MLMERKKERDIPLIHYCSIVAWHRNSLSHSGAFRLVGGGQGEWGDGGELVSSYFLTSLLITGSPELHSSQQESAIIITDLLLLLLPCQQVIGSDSPLTSRLQRLSKISKSVSNCLPEVPSGVSKFSLHWFSCYKHFLPATSTENNL